MKLSRFNLSTFLHISCFCCCCLCCCCPSLTPLRCSVVAASLWARQMLAALPDSVPTLDASSRRFPVDNPQAPPSYSQPPRAWPHRPVAKEGGRYILFDCLINLVRFLLQFWDKAHAQRSRFPTAICQSSTCPIC